MKPRFEGQPLVDAYGDGGFRLDGRRIEGSILLTPRGLYPWAPRALGEATPVSLKPIADCVGEFDFFLVGGGRNFVQLPQSVSGYLRTYGITPDLMDTGAACRTYNILRAEKRRVAAALIAVA